MQRCLSTPESSDDGSWRTSQHRDVQISRLSPHSPTPQLLLREWAREKLAYGSWKDALTTAVNVSIFSSASHLSDVTVIWSLWLQNL